MAGRSIRMALLTLATWALLFAPGAAAEEAEAGAEPVSSERVAAAVMAPTFGSDGVVIARGCRDDDTVQQDCGSGTDEGPGAMSLPVPQRGSSAIALDEAGGIAAAERRSAPTRGPPTG